MSRLAPDFVTQFLYDEAELIDEWRLDEWIQLFSAECVYWIPARLGDDVDPVRDTSHVYDDRSRLEERVWRLTHGPAYRQMPRSELSHLVSNIRVMNTEDEFLVVTSRFTVAEFRKGQQRIFAGRATHHLQPGEGDDLTILMKRVDLIDSNSPFTNLSMVL